MPATYADITHDSIWFFLSLLSLTFHSSHQKIHILENYYTTHTVQHKIDSLAKPHTHTERWWLVNMKSERPPTYTHERFRNIERLLLPPNKIQSVSKYTLRDELSLVRFEHIYKKCNVISMIPKEYIHKRVFNAHNTRTTELAHLYLSSCFSFVSSTVL